MMSRKSKGINAERELIPLFWEKGWAAIRVAGSGSMKFPCPDVVAGNGIRTLAIECKSTKDNSKYLTKQEISDLKTFSLTFGAESWVGIRFDRKPWLFFTIESLKETDCNYSIKLNEALKKGVIFDDLIKPKNS